MLTILTIVSFKSSHAIARVAIHVVGARGTVLARAAVAFVNIYYKKTLEMHSSIGLNIDNKGVDINIQNLQKQQNNSLG